jgi:hypothetical protein
MEQRKWGENVFGIRESANIKRFSVDAGKCGKDDVVLRFRKAAVEPRQA